MPDIDFVDVLWEKQKEYMKELQNPYLFSRFKSFKNVFNYFESGQTVAQIACGSILSDLFLTMDRIGKEGKIILIDEIPDFIYKRALEIVGKENLPKEKDYYVKTEGGKKQLQKLFSQANVEAYIQHLPPYPNEIQDKSLDHVMGINCAFELMARRSGGPPADPAGIIVETYKKLKNGGSFILQGLMGGDIDGFGLHVYELTKENKLNFEREWELKYPPLGGYAKGYWERWVKKE